MGVHDTLLSIELTCGSVVTLEKPGLGAGLSVSSSISIIVDRENSGDMRIRFVL
jgi:hypothetical protein